MKVLLRALAGDWRNCRPLYFPRLPAVSPSNPSKYTVYCTLLINPMESLPHACLLYTSSKQADEEALFGRLDLSSLIPGGVPEEDVYKRQP